MVKNYRTLAVISAITLMMAWFNPLQFEQGSLIVFTALLFAVACWATDAIHKTLSCAVLLSATFVVGKTNSIEIIEFLWSNTNLMIVMTTLLSVALLKSNLLREKVAQLFTRYAHQPLVLFVLPYLLGVLLIVLVPQAFARVIIIGTILDGLLQAKTDGQARAKSAFIFNAFIGISIAYMLFSNGDIVLNLSALKFAGEEIASQLTFWQWFVMMSVPVAVTAIVTLGVTTQVFKEPLSHLTAEMVQQEVQQSSSLSSEQEVISLLTMASVVGGWIVATALSIPSWIVASIGVLVLFVTRVLSWADLKSVNGHFIFFLMTVFNIGKILGQNGVSQVLFERLRLLIPQEQSVWLLVMTIVVVMVLHLCIGSSVATLSVVSPIVLPLMQSLGYNGSTIVLMMYVIVNIHFLLPFHHAVMLMGTGKKYYSEQHLMRYGAVMTVVTPLLLLVVYFGWWALLGK